MHSPTNRVAQLGDRAFCLFDIRVRLLVPRDGKRGAKKTGRRIDSWNLDGERVIRGGSAVGRHGCNIADPSWVGVVIGRTGQDGRNMWASCHADSFPAGCLILSDVE